MWLDETYHDLICRDSFLRPELFLVKLRLLAALLNHIQAFWLGISATIALLKDSYQLLCQPQQKEAASYTREDVILCIWGQCQLITDSKSSWKALVMTSFAAWNDLYLVEATTYNGSWELQPNFSFGAYCRDTQCRLHV